VIIEVVWEDQRGGPQKGFAPGQLVDACLRDRRGLSPYDALPATVRHNPKKGNANVLRALWRDQPHAQGPMFAVLDLDRVDRAFAPPWPVACKQAVLDRIVADCAEFGVEQDPKHVVFLAQNMETLVNDCLAALGEPLLPPGTKPTPDERDRLIAKAAWRDAATRSSVLERNATLRRLVEKVDATMP